MAIILHIHAKDKKHLSTRLGYNRFMEEQSKQKMSKHVCACGSSPLASFNFDPVFEIVKALDDEDALTILRELTKKEIRSPWPNGLFGMDEQRTSKAMRKLLVSGLINSRIDGADHIYFIHVQRFKPLKELVDGCVNNNAEKA